MTRQVDPTLREIFDQMPGCWGCKDENSRFMYVNETAGKLVGLKNHLDIIGLTDFDLPCGASACAALFQAQDQEVMASAKQLTTLDIHPYAGGEYRAYVFTKAPLRDDDKNIIGTIFYGQDIASASNLEVALLLGRMHVNGKTSELAGQGSYLFSQDRASIQLTARESEVLFFLLRGKPAKTISSILDLPDRTVVRYVASLKRKFSAANKYDLMDRAIGFGYLNYIPQSLLSQQLSVVLRDATNTYQI